ncbi:MAG: type II toxin-antitoxin system RelE/ParE family toxin [Proteobacteria bacterium]|nr:type II toxin-antitoxin system RelE/ParE family toxin [Pseudomonadota bacterium]
MRSAAAVRSIACDSPLPATRLQVSHGEHDTRHVTRYTSPVRRAAFPPRVQKGDRKGQHAIAVNDQWRICFRFDDGDAYDVEFCDYH